MPVSGAMMNGVRALANAITPEDGVMLTGILSSDRKNNFYNSAYFVHHSGELLGQYHKQHLVPFGEYIPFRQLPFIDAIAGQGEFSKGGAVEDIYIEPFGYIRVLICYEIIFPAFIARDKRPSICSLPSAMMRGLATPLARISIFIKADCAPLKKV